jgi:hypothetical protein
MTFLNLESINQNEIVFASLFLLAAAFATFYLVRLLKFKDFNTGLSESENQRLLIKTLEKLKWEIKNQLDEKTIKVYANKKKLFSQPDYIFFKIGTGFIKINSLHYSYGGKSQTTNDYLTEFVQTFRQIKKEKITADPGTENYKPDEKTKH